jgi:hypothetical protein
MVLPEGLEFLKLGWWLVHVLGVWLVWSYAYRKGRKDERSYQREKARAGGADAAEPPRPPGPRGSAP